MKRLLIVPMFLILSTVAAQFRVTAAIKKYELPVMPAKLITPSPLGLQPDEQGIYTYQSPSLTSLPASSSGWESICCSELQPESISAAVESRRV